MNGVFSEVVSTFSGKPLFGYRSMVSAIVFEVNGHTPGAVNLRARNHLPAVSLMDGRAFR